MKIFKESSLLSCRKNNYKCWAYEKVGHYVNECTYRKNNKLIEALGSLEYIELSEDEALDLFLSNNKVIVEIIMDN